MRDLTLKKIETGRKSAKFCYRVFDQDELLCERNSNRDYAACYVTKNENSYDAPYFFGRIDLIGKGDSRHLSPDRIYGLATLK